MTKHKSLTDMADFLFEMGLLAKTPRSGFNFLGSGKQSVAEHVCRAAFVGYVLASMDPSANLERTVIMCLLHDIAEARTSDLNYVHQKYVHADEKLAVGHMTQKLPFGDGIRIILDEYEQRATKEALLAKDADNIEWILSLKEQADVGNRRAEEWIGHAVKRLKTEVAQALAEQICCTYSDHWYAEPESKWWVERNMNQQNRF